MIERRKFASAALETLGISERWRDERRRASRISPNTDESQRWLAVWLLRYHTPVQSSYPDIAEQLGYKSHASVLGIDQRSRHPDDAWGNPVVQKLVRRFHAICDGKDAPPALVGPDRVAAWQAVFGGDE